MQIELEAESSALDGAVVAERNGLSFVLDIRPDMLYEAASYISRPCITCKLHGLFQLLRCVRILCSDLSFDPGPHVVDSVELGRMRW
jgi:hypothetical protein